MLKTIFLQNELIQLSTVIYKAFFDMQIICSLILLVTDPFSLLLNIVS